MSWGRIGEKKGGGIGSGGGWIEEDQSGIGEVDPASLVDFGVVSGSHLRGEFFSI